MTAKEARALTDESIAAEKARANALLAVMIERIQAAAKNGEQMVQLVTCSKHAEIQLRQLLRGLGYSVTYPGEVTW